MRPRTLVSRRSWGRRPGGASAFDASATYRAMVRMRLVDEAIGQAWVDGLVPGEYHSGIGEEGINAGVLAQLRQDDTVHLDHRNTAPMIGRGADPAALMLEVLGSERGMNRGMAGHMHLQERSLGASSDAIVGTGGPLAVGAAVAHALCSPGAVAVAFHGEAAMNQGMLMEAYNMAVAWALPVLFVCKDNKWSITTQSSAVTGGTPADRAAGFGLSVATARGHRVEEVHAAAARLVAQARAGRGPGFLYATCHRPGGHFEGDGLVRLLRTPATMAGAWGPGLKEAVMAEGASVVEKAGGLAEISRRGAGAARDWTAGRRMDPLRRARRLLDEGEGERIERAELAALMPAVTAARAAVAGRMVFGTPEGSR